ncbi:hypothetical protein GCM10022237_00810 [Nocardioides ginsengisoli]|uniref:Uncharacterized protein n=1 Tax=Nocardioides ginsengisoli TaxID=363868 RepID=A0ABW3W3X3_9ACTN
MFATTLATSVAAAILVVAASAGPSAAPAPAPQGFAHPQANGWFPLEPGTTVVLRGTDDGVHFRERVRVTDHTRVIEGVRTRVVRDVLRRADGSLAERTTDFYAADDAGNVWYFGENTATYLPNGHLDSREGTWLAGRDGARPGIIMKAHPKATDAYRQELYPGHAEDQAWTVGFKATLRTPLRRFHHVLRSFEWTRLEPGVVSAKYYAEGIGVVREQDVAGGNEQFVVVAVHRR